MREKPVIEVAAAGLTPISPAEVMKDGSAAVKQENHRNVLMMDSGTVEIPDLERIAKLPEAPKTTGPGPTATAPLEIACMQSGNQY
jgi:hypothetical protein